MSSRNQKFLHNSIEFFIVGIISVIRLESVEIIVSFTFSSLFLILNFLIKEGNSDNAIEQFEI